MAWKIRCIANRERKFPFPIHLRMTFFCGRTAPIELANKHPNRDVLMMKVSLVKEDACSSGKHDSSAFTEAPTTSSSGPDISLYKCPKKSQIPCIRQIHQFMILFWRKYNPKFTFIKHLRVQKYVLIILWIGWNI